MDDAWNDLVNRQTQRCYDLIFITAIGVFSTIMIGGAFMLDTSTHLMMVIREIMIAIGMALMYALLRSSIRQDRVLRSYFY